MVSSSWLFRSPPLLLAFLCILQVLQLSIVQARNPDENRHHFLFDVNDGENEYPYSEDDDHPINAFSSASSSIFYNTHEEEEDGDYDEEDVDEHDHRHGYEYEYELSLVKEFNPSLVHALTDEIYEEHNYDLNHVEDVRIKPLFLVDTDVDVVGDSNSNSNSDSGGEGVDEGESATATATVATAKNNVHRVVLWYHPYCANCQRFKSTFVQLARDTINAINANANENDYNNNFNFTIEFHAISCSKHHWLCEEYDLYDAFPIVWVYDYRTKKTSYDYTILEDYTVNGLADMLGFRVRDDGNRYGYGYEYGEGGSDYREANDMNRNGDQMGKLEMYSITSQKMDTTLSTSSSLSSVHQQQQQKDDIQMNYKDNENNNNNGNDNEHEIIDIFGASNDIYKRTRNDIFHDAAISFMHSITSEGDNEDDGQDEERIEVLSEYFDLLYWSLPPSWKILTIVKDIRFTLQDHAPSSSFSSSSSSSSSQPQETKTETEAFPYLYNAIHLMMKNAVISHERFVLNHEFAGWTPSCRFSSTPSSPSSSSSKLVTKKDGGFQCGLWNLLHIISIGVAERHKAVLGGRDRVSTEHAALSVENYLSHFILKDSKSGGTGDGDLYWKTFLDMYKRDCGHYNYKSKYKYYIWGGNRDGKTKMNMNCKRFQRTKKKKSSQYYTDISHWREFPLWLWEVHNEMNVHALRERMKQRGQTTTVTSCCTKDDEKKVLFPSEEDCPTCRLHNGNWDREEVYKYLKGQYWPSGIHNFRYVVLDVKDQHNTKGEKEHIPDNAIDIIIGFGLIGFVLYYKRLHSQTRQQQIADIDKKHYD